MTCYSGDVYEFRHHKDFQYRNYTVSQEEVILCHSHIGMWWELTNVCVHIYKAKIWKDEWIQMHSIWRKKHLT